MSDLTRTRLNRVLVTGGHGFIGRHVVAALDEAGTDVVSVAQSGGTPWSGLPGSTLSLDLEDGERVAEAVRGVDGVVHLAARAGGIQFQEDGGDAVFSSNRLMTDNLLAACAGVEVERLFLASSLVTYRPSDERLTETDLLLGPADRPSPYAWSKITDEVVASWLSGIETVIGRFGNVFGPGASFEPERSTVVHALINRAARLGDGEDLVVWGDGNAVRSFVFVEDAAQGVLVALTAGESGEAYNIDSGVEVTIDQLASTVRDQVNPTLKVVFDKSKPAGLPYRVASIDKLESLGYAPSVDLEEGIRRTVEWYRETVASA